MINITRKSLEFFKKEALQFAPKIVEFIMFNDKFENSRKTLEAKSAKDRSKEEIDSYNVMVKQVNNEINTYNKLNSANFQEKNNILNEWNVTGENFISSHVPVD